MSIQLSVIAPCYNEEKNIGELVARLLRTFAKKKIAGEIVLVNDGSQDNTGQIIDQLAAVHQPQIITVHHSPNQGIYSGWKSGLQRASGKYVCFIDSDLQNLPEDVWRLYKEIKNSRYDVVQGFRSSIGRLRDSRYILSRGLNFLLNILFGMRLQDNKSGFVISQKEIMANILSFRYRYFYPQTFIAIAAHTRGYSIKQIETLFQSRLLGDSFITKNPLKPVLLTFIDLLLALGEFRLFFKKENILEQFLHENASAEVRAKKDAGLTSWWRRLMFHFYFLTFPLHTWMLSRNCKKYYYELQQSQWLSPEQIKALQEKKLRKLIWHAYNHVGYYRDKFDELGIKPEDITTIESLQRLPLIDKNEIRENLHFDLLADNYRKDKILPISTSGSTGEPFTCYVDRHQLEMRWAATLRSMEWTGYRFGDRQARLWHQNLGLSFGQIIKERIDALLTRRLFIPAFRMSQHNLQQMLQKLQHFRPALIDGYAESFNFLAHYIKHHNVVDFPRLKGIVSSAQVLPEQSRELIEKSFSCKVFDKYGSREFSGIAYESEAHAGHLVAAENYIVEILKDGRPARPGETGEIIITDLNNYCMPFIRYRIGDLAVAIADSPPSPCGRGLPRIGTIEGRVQAIICGTNGNYLPGTFFAHLFKDYDYIIKQYQVIQEHQGVLTLRIVKAERFDAKILDRLIGVLHDYLGNDLQIEIEFVEEIAMVRTGKHQGSISRLAIDFQNIQGKIAVAEHHDEQE